MATIRSVRFTDRTRDTRVWTCIGRGTARRVREGPQLLASIKGGAGEDPIQYLGIGGLRPGLVSRHLRIRDADSLGESRSERPDRCRAPRIISAEAMTPMVSAQRLKALVPSSQPMSAPLADSAKMIRPAPAMARFFMNMAISVVLVGSSSDQK